LSDQPSRVWRSLDLVAVTVPYFQRRGVDQPRLAAELLLAHALGWKRLDLFTRFEQDLPADKVDAFREMVRRRGDREPLQHILGKASFRTLELRCDRRALTPRPETEELAAEAARLLAGLEAPLVADLGAGTGCIAISLALAAPTARVVATDISAEALDLARENVAAHKLADRVRLLRGNLCAPLLAEGLTGMLDLVVSNPPYVKTGEIAILEPEVRDHDPRVALDGGPDGLDFYRRILDEARPLMKPGGAMALELPEDGAAAVSAMAAELGWGQIVARKDMQGVERILLAKWQG